MYSLLIFLFLIFSPGEYYSLKGFDLVIEQGMEKGEIVKMKEEIERFSMALTEYFGGEKRFNTIIYVRNNLPPGKFPEWGVGFFVPRENSIYLRMRSYSGRDAFYRVLRHEMTHAWLYDLWGKRRFWPLWLEEGICDFLSGKRIGLPEAQKLSFALMSKRVLPLDSLAYLPERWNVYNIQLFYTESLFIVELLSEQGKLKNFILSRGWNNGEGLPPGFRDWIDFEIWWQTELESRYKWYILLNFEMVIAILIVIVFLIAYISKIVQKRKQLRLLAETEEDSSE
jgi:hypothetical protein